MLNKNGYRRDPRPVGRHEVFTDFFIKSMLDNPVYTGKVVYGRFGTEKIPGTRNEYRSVRRDALDEQVIKVVQQAVNNLNV